MTTLQRLNPPSKSKSVQFFGAIAARRGAALRENPYGVTTIVPDSPWIVQW